jgi:beta-lactamase regulating signal transducer with metallopeptidase domain/Tfp pilus assembly protein PilF
MATSRLAVLIDSLGWTLVHFVWQAAFVALALWLFLQWAHKATPNVRYLAGCTALGLACVGFAVTFGWQCGRSLEVGAASVEKSAPPGDVVAPPPLVEFASKTRSPAPATKGADHAPPIGLPRTRSFEARLRVFQSAMRDWLPAVVCFWSIGVGLLSLRLIANWNVVQRIRTECKDVEDAAWAQRFAMLRRRLHVDYPVRLLRSTEVSVPLVIGWLKPVVLVPGWLLTGLSSEQLEAILAHELAHVRRHDYLVNLLQNLVETIFFYHPAVWWVSGQIRKEREHCCDDVAVRACDSTLVYARALTALEELRAMPGSLGIAASGGSLIERIKRLTRTEAVRQGHAGWPLAAGVLLLGAMASVLIVGNLSLANQGDVEGFGTIRPVAYAKLDQRRSGLAFSVVDAVDRAPIPQFRVLWGSRVGDISTKTKETEAINWRVYDSRETGNGVYFLPWGAAKDEVSLRVEADGYRPHTTPWIKKPRAPQSLILELVRDSPGPSGRKPAHHYQVGDRIVATRQAPIAFEGKPVDRAYMGWVYVIERIEGNKLWVAAKTPGWIDDRYVIPFQTAFAYFSEMLKRDATDRWALQARATVLMFDEQLEAAIGEFSELIRQYPTDGAMWNDRGRAWAKLGDYDHAISDYSEAIRLYPVSPVYFDNRARAWAKKGDYVQAIRDWKSALKLRPKFQAPQAELANLLATCPDETFRNGKEAMARARAVCEQSTWQNADDLQILAAACAESGKFDEAIQWQTMANGMRANEPVRQRGAARLALYKQGLPYRQSGVETATDAP